MKRTNNIMKIALLSTMIVGNAVVGTTVFAADNPTVAPATAVESSPAGDTSFRLDEGTYVQIRDVYGSLVLIPGTLEAPIIKQAPTAVTIFGGYIEPVKSKNLDK